MGVALLIFANKQDLVTALSPEDVSNIVNSQSKFITILDRNCIKIGIY
jgi:signal recognition particle receptor subunit beta